MNLRERVDIIERTLDLVSEEPLENILKAQTLALNLKPEEELEIFEDILSELQGYGPIHSLLEDSNVTEILIDNYDDISAEKSGLLEKCVKEFSTPITYNRFVKKLLIEMDRTADQRHPLADGILLNGNRVHVALPPVTANPVISIRKHQKSKWSLKNLTDAGALSAETATKLQTALAEKKNILISGPTGAGKTTFLRALLGEVDISERIVIVEDTAELSLERKNSASLLTRTSLENLFPEINLGDLLKNALRMRPDRLVIGEIRGEEALVFLDALSTGHSGSMSSIHGNTAKQALGRLEQLASRAAPQWSMEAIRKLVYDGVDLVICIERKNGSRKIREIAELTGLESFGYLLNPWPLDPN